MAVAKKTLGAVNDALEVACTPDQSASGSVSTTAGTVVVEGSVLDEGDWFALPLRNNSTAPATDAMNLAAAGMAYFDVLGLAKVRVRLSAGGPADVALGLTYP